MGMVYGRNLNTGKVAKVPEHYLTHPVFSKHYEPADRHDKNYLPEMYKPPVDGETKRTRRNRSENKNEEPVVVTEPVITIEAEGGDLSGR